jgi:cytochrome c-type biogenesis protein
MESNALAMLSALWLGILTSVSPCPLSTNIAAVSYVGRHVGSPRAVLLAGGLYMGGRMLAYVVLGAAAVWSLMSVVAMSAFLQGTVHRLIGPLLIVVGLLVLGLFDFTLPGIGISEGLQRRVDQWGVWGAGVLGILFAFAFCPVSAALFFGSLVPLAADHGSPLLLPSVYGVGTALPVAGFAVLLAAGSGWFGRTVHRVQTIEPWARRVTAIVLIGVGVFETLRSTLYLISV